MTWSVPQMWKGEDVWIIGGGPSVAKQFDIPSDIVKQVVEGTSPLSVYSSYMKFLHNKHVVGINVAYLLGDWVDVVFFGDPGFFLTHKKALLEFKGLKVTCNPTVERFSWVKFLARDHKHTKGISPHRDKVSWNHNSGAASISFVAHTGANRIFLLGFDMKLSNSGYQHWHDVYHRGVWEPKKKKKLPFSLHLAGFLPIAKDANKLGIEIINVCPDSAIDCFPRVSLKSLI